MFSRRRRLPISTDHWQVELFFKAIKQNLKIHVFVGNSKNAVLTRIWIAICAYLMLACLKFTSRSGWSQQRILCVYKPAYSRQWMCSHRSDLRRHPRLIVLLKSNYGLDENVEQ
ncbi:MAG: hypothetical protein HKP12_03135 [Gammaproteobacteria bacterium]|nr:hypothetical protein [Gammaproteobacteria bacterium]NNJ96129.1 hypothetical protein [Gammaproteobacteria bacterium]